MLNVRDDYAPQFGRQVLSVWESPFASSFVATAVELPKHDGYMVHSDAGKIRVECPAPRTEDNFTAVDDALTGALAVVRSAYGA